MLDIPNGTTSTTATHYPGVMSFLNAAGATFLDGLSGTAVNSGGALLPAGNSSSTLGGSVSPLVNYSSVVSSSPSPATMLSSGSANGSMAPLLTTALLNVNGTGLEYGETGSNLTHSFTNFVHKEFIFDRTDVRVIFITLYSLVFCCCFFGKYGGCYWNASNGFKSLYLVQ